MGMHVEKLFCGKWYVGKVTEYDTCESTGEPLWRVKYDDDDFCDYNRKELIQIVCEDLDELL